MEAILYICILAVGHAVFMAAVLLYLNHRLSNRLLAILLILLAIRVGKSVVQILLKPDMSYTTSVVGVIAMASIGPVLFMFIKSLFSSNSRFRRIDLLHFVPAASLPVFVFSGWKLLAPVYYAMTAHVIIYTLWSWYHLFRNRALYRADDLRWQWAILLLSAITVLETSFVLQVTVYEPTIYLSNVIIAALLLYTLSFWAIRRARIFISDPHEGLVTELLEVTRYAVDQLQGVVTRDVVSREGVRPGGGGQVRDLVRFQSGRKRSGLGHGAPIV